MVAASGLFAQQGYFKTTISDIEQATGLSRGTVFYHFKDKPELAKAILHRCCDRFAQLTEFTTARFPDSPREALLQIFDRLYLDHHQIGGRVLGCPGGAQVCCPGGPQLGCPLWNMSFEMADTEGLQKTILEVFNQWSGRIRQLLEHAKQLKQLSARANVQGLTETIVALIQGAVMQARLTGDPSVFERAKTTFAQLLTE